MKKNIIINRLNCINTAFLFFLSLMITGKVANATTYFVSNTSDSGAGSLRTAITSANGNAGADIIDFSLLPAGIQTIVSLSALPLITDQVTIDGYTSASYSANNPKIEIQCTTGVVLDISGASANGSIIRGLIINNGSQYGIRLNSTSNMTIAGCWIGLSNIGGMPLAANQLTQSGIQLTNNSNNNTIGGTISASRNVIGASKSYGIEIINTSTGNTIAGNYIGIAPNGMTSAGNASVGVYINGCINNTIGGTSIACRNIISGNTSYGIDIENSSTGIIIQSNFLGIAKDGITIVQNGSHGIFLNNLAGNGTEMIGGTTFAERNVCSGNSMTTNAAGNGISLNGCSNIKIKGNWSGVDSTGLIAVPNYWGGLSFWQCTNCTIGGPTQYERNILSGNTNEGFFIGGGGGHTIIGNYIGVGSDGVTAIGNKKLGINMQDAGGTGTVNNIIGGSLANANIITNNGFINAGTTPVNTGAGLSLTNSSTKFNEFTFNHIYCNAGAAILFTNFPNINLLPPGITSSGTNSITGTGTTGYTVHVYRNQKGGLGCDCEAEIYVGTAVVAGGTWTVTHNLGLSVAGASSVTATITDVNSPVPNTSPLAACSTPLPIQLLFFNATSENNTSILEWSTTSESSNKYFIIERSKDGIHFDSIGVAYGGGTSNSILPYSFIDATPLSGTNYYKLVQIDYDGRRNYSSISIVQISNNYDFLDLSPNPGNGIYKINTLLQQSFEISLYNSIGEFMGTQTISPGQKTLDLSYLANGLYVINFVLDTTRKSIKLIKE